MSMQTNIHINEETELNVDNYDNFFTVSINVSPTSRAVLFLHNEEDCHRMISTIKLGFIGLSGKELH